MHSEVHQLGTCVVPSYLINAVEVSSSAHTTTHDHGSCLLGKRFGGHRAMPTS